jgi:hypothetical protein
MFSWAGPRYCSSNTGHIRPSAPDTYVFTIITKQAIGELGTIIGNHHVLDPKVGYNARRNITKKFLTIYCSSGFQPLGKIVYGYREVLLDTNKCVEVPRMSMPQTIKGHYSGMHCSTWAGVYLLCVGLTCSTTLLAQMHP